MNRPITSPSSGDGKVERGGNVSALGSGNSRRRMLHHHSADFSNPGCGSNACCFPSMKQRLAGVVQGTLAGKGVERFYAPCSSAERTAIATWMRLLEFTPGHL